MKIKSLRIRNYKSFFDSGEVFFGSGFNLVIGKNNSGKTAFIEALKPQIENKPHTSTLNVKDENDQRRLPSEREIVIEYTSKDIITYLRNIPIGSSFSILSPDENSSIQPMDALEMYSLSNIEVRYTTSPSNGNRIIGKSSHPYVPIQDINPVSDDTVMMHTFLINSSANYELIGKSLYHPNNELSSQLSNFASGHIYYFNAERYKVGASPYLKESNLHPDAGNLPGVLSYLANKRYKVYDTLVKYIKEIFPSIIDLRVINGDNGFEIVTWLEDLDDSRPDLAISLDSSGTGVGQILAMLYVVVTSSLPQVIIIDEPNNFLHPGASRHLIEILKLYPQHQYFLTTHSPEIIRSLDSATVHIITWERPQSRVETINSQNAQDILRIFTEVGARFSDVYGADDILWVEGETEEICFKLISKSLMNSERVPLISPVGAVSEFESEKRVKLIMDIYNKLSTSNGLLPTPVGFIFDREKRTVSDLEKLKFLSDNKIHFTKKRHYENYLLDKNALVAVMNELETFKDDKLTSDKIESWISDNGLRRKYIEEEFMGPLLQNIGWISNVNAAKLLSDMFNDLSDSKESYRKTIHSPALTQWLIDNNPESLSEIVDLIREAIK